MSVIRVISYIDGFNLYFGLREKNWKQFYWLNVEELSRNLLKDDQELVAVKYFTSRVSSASSGQAQRLRQNSYLEAVEDLPLTEIFYGHYLPNFVECPRCYNKWNKPEEKMTDVNIAVEMLIDAQLDKFDVALLISGDSDLYSPIKRTQQLHSDKRVVVAFPPERVSVDLKAVASGSINISKRPLRRSKLDDPYIKKDGIKLKKPAGWVWSDPNPK